MKALFDTNIIIDYLNGEEKARQELQQYSETFISPITWMEVMVGADANESAIIMQFLLQFGIVPIDQKVSEIAVNLRKTYKIKLPDAIIWASAQVVDALLITRDLKDFPEHVTDIRHPYRIQKDACS